MIPVGDTQIRGSGPGYVTYGLIALNIIVFILMLTSNPQEVVNQYGVIPAEIVNGQDLITLITSMFLHGGWYHLGSNMLFLWIFGDNVEHTLGHVLYLLVYLAGGIAASAAQILVNPASTIPSVGASGAIAAILGAYVVMFPHSRVKVLIFLGFTFLVTQVTALLFLGIWFVSQLFNGIGSLGVETAQTGGIAFWAHIGGFVFGLLVGFLFRGQAERFDYGRG